MQLHFIVHLNRARLSLSQALCRCWCSENPTKKNEGVRDKTSLNTFYEIKTLITRNNFLTDMHTHTQPQPKLSSGIICLTTYFFSVFLSSLLFVYFSTFLFCCVSFQVVNDANWEATLFSIRIISAQVNFAFVAFAVAVLVANQKQQKQHQRQQCTLFG